MGCLALKPQKCMPAHDIYCVFFTANKKVVIQRSLQHVLAESSDRSGRAAACSYAVLSTDTASMPDVAEHQGSESHYRASSAMHYGLHKQLQVCVLRSVCSRTAATTIYVFAATCPTIEGVTVTQTIGAQGVLLFRFDVCVACRSSDNTVNVMQELLQDEGRWRPVHESIQEFQLRTSVLYKVLKYANGRGHYQELFVQLDFNRYYAD